MNLPVTRIHRKANFIPVTDLKLFDLSLERHEATCTNSQTRHFIPLYSQRNLEVRLSMFIERPLIPLWFLIPRVGEKDRWTRLASSCDQVRWNWRNVEEKSREGGKWIDGKLRGDDKRPMTTERDGMTKDLAKNFDRFQPLRNYRTLSPLFAFIILANSTILPILVTRMTNERARSKRRVSSFIAQ